MAITLESLKRNTPKIPIISVVGQPGVGKTTLCANAPDTIFLPTESGLGSLDVQSFPKLRTVNDVYDCIDVFHNYYQEHQKPLSKSLCIDSIDGLQQILFDEICKRHNVTAPSDIPYGGASVEALVMFNEILIELDYLRETQNMGIHIIAHTEITTVKDPTMQAYDRHDLKLHKNIAARVREFSDIILFCHVDIALTKEKDSFGGRNRAIGGDHIMHTSSHPAFVAKSRFDIPDELPMKWSALEKSLAQYFTDVSSVVKDSKEPTPTTAKAKPKGASTNAI